MCQVSLWSPSLWNRLDSAFHVHVHVLILARSQFLFVFRWRELWVGDDRLAAELAEGRRWRESGPSRQLTAHLSTWRVCFISIIEINFVEDDDWRTLQLMLFAFSGLILRRWNSPSVCRLPRQVLFYVTHLSISMYYLLICFRLNPYSQSTAAAHV